MSESLLKVDNREGDSKRNWLYAKRYSRGPKTNVSICPAYSSCFILFSTIGVHIVALD